MDYLAVTTSTQLNAVNVPAVASRNNGETPGSSLSFVAELNRALETRTLSEPGVAGTPADSKPQPSSGTDGARATGSPVAPPAPEPSSPVPGGTVTAESQVPASPSDPRFSQADSNGPVRSSTHLSSEPSSGKKEAPRAGDLDAATEIRISPLGVNPVAWSSIVIANVVNPNAGEVPVGAAFSSPDIIPDHLRTQLVARIQEAAPQVQAWGDVASEAAPSSNATETPIDTTDSPATAERITDPRATSPEPQLTGKYTFAAQAEAAPTAERITAPAATSPEPQLTGKYTFAAPA